MYTFGTCIAFFIVIGDQLDRCEYYADLMTHTPATLFLSFSTDSQVLEMLNSSCCFYSTSTVNVPDVVSQS